MVINSLKWEKCHLLCHNATSELFTNIVCQQERLLIHERGRQTNRKTLKKNRSSIMCVVLCSFLRVDKCKYLDQCVSLCNFLNIRYNAKCSPQVTLKDRWTARCKKIYCSIQAKRRCRTSVSVQRAYLYFPLSSLNAPYFMLYSVPSCVFLLPCTSFYPYLCIFVCYVSNIRKLMVV